MADVSLRGVSKALGDTQAVDDLTLPIKDGEFVVLLGPTGAGKTTTLRLVAGLERPESGSIVIGGRDVTKLEPASRDVAFVFQQYSLYPHLTVAETLPSRCARPPANGRRPRSRAASPRWRRWCVSTTSWRTKRHGFPAARCSAWQSAVLLCASRRST